MGEPEGVDNTVPEGPWVFDSEVTAVFENMLKRSIPQYEVMRREVFELACHFRQPHTDLLDLGCSNGLSLAQLVDRFGATNRYVGVEISQPMLEAAKERFKGLPNHVIIKEVDLRKDFPFIEASVVMSILTIQFVPIEYRLLILQKIYDCILPGGAFIWVEKVLGASAQIDQLMVSQYLDMKRENGYSEEQIQRKRLSLEGRLVPLPARMNEEFLRMVGFRESDCFWRWHNFAGWLAIKGK